ncbi:MAG: FtsH protease activity modulator HflK [Oscillospiraceae bacterium]|jgi:membrane protease subunit HflK|nr:FtsH protease activity modulator HflK [Oscillospiraceae bacterium]
MRKLKWFVPLAFALVLVLILSFAGVYRVGQGEEGLVLTFGRVTDHKEPGVYWRMPFIQQVRTKSVTTIYTQEYGFRTTRSGAGTTAASYTDVASESVMLTGDNNIAQVEAIYQYTIRDVQQYLYSVDDPISTLHLAFEAVIRRNIQNRPLDDALLNKEEIERQVLPDFQNMLDSYDIGVQIRNVRIQNITVPAEVTAAYEDVNNAKNENTRMLDDAQKYRNSVVPQSRSSAYATLQDAEGYRAITVANAQAEIAVFNSIYEKYQAAPEITRKRLLIETLESVLTNADRKIILEGGQTILLSDLPKLAEGELAE